MYELVQYGILTIISTYLILRYAAPSVSLHVKFWSILTWVLNFGLALLVPQDTYITLHTDKKHPAKFKIENEYLILYWTVYILTWTIIPVLQEWENSGDLESKDRLKRSLKVNALFYLYMLVGGVAVLIVLIFLNVGGDMGLVTYLKCLATCWGIFLQMIMMGYAIVEIPRSLWMEGNPNMHLQYCYKKIPEIDEEISDALFEFKQICAYILYMQETRTNEKEIQEYCRVSLECIPEHLKFEIPTKYADYLSHMNYLENNPVSLESAIEHHRLIIRVIARLRRLKITLKEFIDEGIFCGDVAEALNNGENIKSDLIEMTSFKNFWYLKLEPFLNKLAAIFLTVFGLLITIAETQVFLTNKSSFLHYIIIWDNNLELTRILIFLTIFLISYMVYYSLFRIKLSNLYGMYKNESDGPSIMFVTINFSRVGVAIVLNFFDMIKLDSIYKDAMSTVDMGLLGEWVIKGMPGVLWLIILCHYYDLWGKIVRKFKLSDNLQFSSHLVDESEVNDVPRQVTQRREELRKEKKSRMEGGDLKLSEQLIR